MGTGNNTETIGQIESLWKRIYPEIPFTYYFLDDGLKATYANESRISKIYTLFCSIALFIACMGLFALASYTIQKRLKEISVRKVLGASASSIVVLIYRDFLLLILIAFLIATPVSIIIFNNWLSTFAYLLRFPVRTSAALPSYSRARTPCRRATVRCNSSPACGRG